MMKRITIPFQTVGKLGFSLRCFATKREIIVKPTVLTTLFTIEPIAPELLWLQPFISEKNKMFSTEVKYVSPIELKYAIPKLNKAEVAFIGRSNVGKSSLINALIGEKLARVSKEPGCTKTMNFFAFVKDAKDVKEDNMSAHLRYVVDLPGYGFARVSKTLQQQWIDIMTSYLEARDQSVLRRVFILIDARHGIKTSDMEIIELIGRYHIPSQIIFTKCDQVTPQQLQENLQNTFEFATSKKARSVLPYIFVTSAKQNIGMDALKVGLTEIYSQNWTNETSTTNESST